MKTKLLSIARRNYCRPYIPSSTQRHNILAYARAVHRLGDRWLLAYSIDCTTKENANA
jgi:hypothetical protein